MSSSAALRKHLSKYLHPSHRSIFNQVNLEKLLSQEVAQHSPFPSAHKGPRSLAVDIKEFNNQIELVAEVPGLSKYQVQLEIHEGNILTLSGEYKPEETSETIEKNNIKYHCAERSFGKFERAFQFPDHIKLEHIKAQMKDGVLKLLIPKEQPKPVRRKISIDFQE